MADGNMPSILISDIIKTWTFPVIPSDKRSNLGREVILPFQDHPFNAIRLKAKYYNFHIH